MKIAVTDTSMPSRNRFFPALLAKIVARRSTETVCAQMRPLRFLLIGGLADSLINFRGPLLQALKDSGCEVHAAAAQIEASPRVVGALSEMGIIAHSVPIARAGLNPISDFRALAALISLVRRTGPDVVLAYTIKPVVWGMLAAWIARVPQRYAMITGLGYAFTGRAEGKRALVQWVARLLYRATLRRASGVFFQNPDDLAIFRNQCLVSKRVPMAIVNGSGVDLNHYFAQPLPQGPLSFLMIARLLGDKGVREYAAAAAEIRRQHPHVTFHLVGDLDPNPDAVSQIELDQWIGSGALIWHGAQSDVRPFLGASHVFVLPSYREGLPRTVLEAMATGRPVITTSAPGCRETVTDGFNGFLVPPRSHEALTSAMRRFLADPSLISDMAVRSLQLAREKYAAERVAHFMLKTMGIKAQNTT